MVDIWFLNVSLSSPTVPVQQTSSSEELCFGSPKKENQTG